ncbi:hypothetical protein CEXT_570331 [Caerostris extrusa]|uniref:Uncharacterized protein n=1 Tax=Caerostris extrusa TaxID=172846 RepID=A0AAV4QDM0_CAEEX|nr:hypothetical protein CEXT_570331 [Caerostris extrusa]
MPKIIHIKVFTTVYQTNHSPNNVPLRRIGGYGIPTSGINVMVKQFLRIYVCMFSKVSFHQIASEIENFGMAIIIKEGWYSRSLQWKLKIGWKYLRRDKTYSADQRWLSGRKRSLIRWPHLDNRYRHLTNNRYWPLENFSVKMVPDPGVALNLYKSCLLTGKRQKFQVLDI